MTTLSIASCKEIRAHCLQDGVEVVGINLDEFAFFQFRQGLFRLSGEVSQHPDHEGQFLKLDRAADFDDPTWRRSRSLEGQRRCRCSTYGIGARRGLVHRHPAGHCALATRQRRGLEDDHPVGVEDEPADHVERVP